jgi:hypothetical protein
LSVTIFYISKKYNRLILLHTEVSCLTGFASQTSYNNIHKKVFIEGTHYFRPCPKKLLFKWEAIVKWIEQSKKPEPKAEVLPHQSFQTNPPKKEKAEMPVSAINI